MLFQCVISAETMGLLMSFDLFKGVDFSTVWLAAAGAAGGAARWYLMSPRPSIPEGLFVLGSGGVMSVIFGPALPPMVLAAIHAVPWWAGAVIDPQILLNGSGYIAGLVGLMVSAFVVEWTRAIGKILVRKAKSGDT